MAIFVRRSAVEDQCCTVFRKGIDAPNREVAMESKRRKMLWAERPNFQGWACNECAWIFNPKGALVGESIEEMKMNYERQRDEEFAAHLCAEYPRAPKNPR
jgi:hypothetical protein